MEIHIEDTQQFFSKTQKTKFRDALKKVLSDDQISSSERPSAVDKVFKTVHFASAERSYVTCSLVEETPTLFRVHFRTKEQEDERRKELATKLKHRRQEVNHIPDPLWSMYHKLKNHTKFLPTPPEVQANRDMFSYLQTTMGEKSPVASYFGMCLE